MDRRYFLKAAGVVAAASRINPLEGIANPDFKLTAAEAPLPEWAKTGNFVFMGLDGGPLEAEKGLRSGWQGFTRDDPQGIVRAVRDFYQTENVEIPRAAGANWVYVTWSNGWSKDRERRDQWPKAARFIEECRKEKMHVSAYISAANMFWEDYLQSVPQSSKWIDTQQPAFMRHYGGSLYRVMANIKLAEWRREIKAALDSALDAGVEGFWVDNLFWWHGRQLFEDFIAEMRAHVARRKGNIVWHTNVNRGIYNWSQVGNVIGTEDGRAPQYKPGSKPAISANLGLLSYLSGLREGWRSAELEHYGVNLSASIRKLMIAEGWMWQVGTTWFPVDRLLQAQWHRREPEAWKILTEMGTYNRHQLKHSEYFSPGESMASVGIIGHPGGSGEELDTQKSTMEGQSQMIGLLDYLATGNIQYEVLFDDRISPAALRRFSVIVLPDPEHVPAGLTASLKAYLKAGGKLIAPRKAWLSSIPGNKIILPAAAFLADKEPELLLSAIRKHDDLPALEAATPPSIIYRGLRQGRRVVSHLLNFKMETVEPFTVRLRGNSRSVTALIPESGDMRSLQARHEGGWTTVSVPEFPIHCLLVFNDVAPTS